MIEPPPGSKDFRALRESGERPGASKSIGAAIAAARDSLARALIAVGLKPDHLTLIGFGFSIAAAYCLFRGASQQVPYFAWSSGPIGWWPTLAAVMLVLAGACDMLDGAIARVGNLGSQAGGVLDSSVDRFSDMAIYIGCFLHFATTNPPSITYQLLAVVALCNAVMISYIKARAEDIIDDCSVGYWLRGERFAAVLIGCTFGHMPAVLWQMAVSCAFTVWRRMTFAYAAVRSLETRNAEPERGPSGRWYGRFQLWRHPRGSVPYDFVTGAHIAYIIFAPVIWPALLAVGTFADPLAAWLGG